MKIPKETPSYANIMNELYYIEKDKKNIICAPDVTFQVTDNCNLRCTYCYQTQKQQHRMPFSVAKDFIDILLENNEYTQQYINTSLCNAIILSFIGGEPFLEVELIDQIVEYFQKATILAGHDLWARNWRICISSNGTLYFNPEVQNFIKKYKNNLALGISIDGNKQLHDKCRIFPDGSGSYDKAIAAAYDYKYNLNGFLTSKITLSPNNIMYLYQAIIDFINFGYDEIFANCIFEKGWTIEHAKIFYNELKKIADYLLDNDLEEKIYFSIFTHNFFHPLKPEDDTNWCGGNGQMLAVDYKGDIYPCLRYMESSLGPNVPPIIIGNVKNGFLFTKEQQNCINCLKQINRINQSTEECMNCPIAQGCAYCQAYNYQDSGNFHTRATYICCMHKARALANAYFWNKCYIKHNDTDRFILNLSEEEALKIIPKKEYEEIKKMELL